MNPTEQPLFVQIDQRPPFEVAPGASAHASIPAIERLSPITITARDAGGATVFFQTTTLPRLKELGRVELQTTGESIDPYADLRPGAIPAVPPAP